MLQPVALAELPLEECIEYLATTSIGRIMLATGRSAVDMPVHYRLVERAGPPWLILRTRPDSGLRWSPPVPVVFEVEGNDEPGVAAWSIVVRGTLHQLDEDYVAPFRDHFNPGPQAPGHDTWLFIKSAVITGHGHARARPEP